MQAYGDAKAKLFETEGLEVAVLNLDDAMGVRLARAATARGLRVIGYGFATAAPAAVDEYLPASLLAAEHTRQVGRFNVANALGVSRLPARFGLGSKDADGVDRRPAAGPGTPTLLGASACACPSR